MTKDKTDSKPTSAQKALILRLQSPLFQKTLNVNKAKSTTVSNSRSSLSKTPLNDEDKNLVGNKRDFGPPQASSSMIKTVKPEQLNKAGSYDSLDQEYHNETDKKNIINQKSSIKTSIQEKPKQVAPPKPLPRSSFLKTNITKPPIKSAPPSKLATKAQQVIKSNMFVSKLKANIESSKNEKLQVSNKKTDDDSKIALNDLIQTVKESAKETEDYFKQIMSELKDLKSQQKEMNQNVNDINLKLIELRLKLEEKVGAKQEIEDDYEEKYKNDF